MDNPFTVTLFDKGFTRRGWLNDPVRVVSTPKHCAIGTTELTVVSDHRRIGLLQAKGARALVEYNGEFLMSGIITNRAGHGPVAGETTFILQDDLWLLQRMLGWPVPAATDPFGTQGTKQDTRTGAAETVAKGFVNANKAHLIDPVTVATDLGRGTTITVSSRMVPLADQLLSEVDAAGIGLTVRMSGSGLVMDAYTPTTFPHTLSPESATILDYDYSIADPTLTAAMVGGPNENTSREFRRRVATALQTAYGYTIEGFVDARSADTYSLMDAAGDAALAEAAAKSSFKVTLSESKTFRYGGNGVHVGDLATMSIDGATLTAPLRECELAFDRDAGLQITPVIGERNDDPDLILARFVGLLAQSIRQLQTR